MAEIFSIITSFRQVSSFNIFFNQEITTLKNSKKQILTINNNKNIGNCDVV